MNADAADDIQHDVHDLGLAHDLRQLRHGMTRRRWGVAAFGTLAGLAVPARGQVQATTCSVIPTETAGPFPANGAGRFGGGAINALALSGIARSDIRSSVAGATGVAGGVPLKLTLRLVDSGASCSPLAGLAVYVWQCDREGRYSMYSAGAREENYLRGVQTSGPDGSVEFTTVFPGCYPGRMPHLHFEVYRSLAQATSGANRLKTSQLALPPEVCEQVYAGAEGYRDSVANLARISFATDGVFRDGVAQQLASVQGSVQAGYAARLEVGISI